MHLSVSLLALASICTTGIALPTLPSIKRDSGNSTLASASASAVSGSATGSNARSLLPVPRTHPARKAAISGTAFQNLSHTISLTYAEDVYSTQVHYGATVNFTTRLPSLVAGDHAEIDSLNSTEAGVFDIIFSTKAAFETAKSHWTTPMIIIAENGQGGCANDTRYQPIHVTHTIAMDEATSTVKFSAYCSTWKKETTFYTISLSQKNATRDSSESSLARRNGGQTTAFNLPTANFNYDSSTGKASENDISFFDVEGSVTMNGGETVDYDISLDCINCYVHAATALVIETGSSLLDGTVDDILSADATLAYASALASYDISGSYLGVVGSLKGNVDLEFNATGDVSNSFYKNLYATDLDSLNILDIIDLGVYLKLVGSGSYDLSGSLKYSTGFDLSVDTFEFILPFNTASTRSAHWSNFKVDHHSTPHPSAELSLEVDVYVEPQILFGVELLFTDDDEALSVGAGVKVGLKNHFKLGNTQCETGMLGLSDSDISSGVEQPHAVTISSPAGLNKNLYDTCWTF
ncbi:hypothetical protein P7C70_g6275, partial [Phenoliferia sp. Uapishka_3]